MSDPVVKRYYRVMARCFHEGRMVQAGTILLLADAEVAAHHELIEDPPLIGRPRPSEPARVETSAEAKIAGEDAGAEAQEEGEHRPRRGRPSKDDR